MDYRPYSPTEAGPSDQREPLLRRSSKSRGKQPARSLSPQDIEESGHGTMTQQSPVPQGLPELPSGPGSPQQPIQVLQENTIDAELKRVVDTIEDIKQSMRMGQWDREFLTLTDSSMNLTKALVADVLKEAKYFDLGSRMESLLWFCGLSSLKTAAESKLKVVPLEMIRALVALQRELRISALPIRDLQENPEFVQQSDAFKSVEKAFNDFNNGAQKTLQEMEKVDKVLKKHPFKRITWAIGFGIGGVIRFGAFMLKTPASPSCHFTLNDQRPPVTITVTATPTGGATSEFGRGTPLQTIAGQYEGIEIHTTYPTMGARDARADAPYGYETAQGVSQGFSTEGALYDYNSYQGPQLTEQVQGRDGYLVDVPTIRVTPARRDGAYNPDDIHMEPYDDDGGLPLRGQGQRRDGYYTDVPTTRGTPTTGGSAYDPDGFHREPYDDEGALPLTPRDRGQRAGGYDPYDDRYTTLQKKYRDRQRHEEFDDGVNNEDDERFYGYGGGADVPHREVRRRYR